MATETQTTVTNEKPAVGRLLLIYFGLICLLISTVIASGFDLGRAGLIIALVIAAAKSFLVMWYYMDLRQAPRLTAIASLAGFLWLSLLLILTFSDYLSRGNLSIFGK